MWWAAVVVAVLRGYGYRAIDIHSDDDDEEKFDKRHHIFIDQVLRHCGSFVALDRVVRFVGCLLCISFCLCSRKRILWKLYLLSDC